MWRQLPSLWVCVLQCLSPGWAFYKSPGGDNYTGRTNTRAPPLPLILHAQVHCFTTTIYAKGSLSCSISTLWLEVSPGFIRCLCCVVPAVPLRFTVNNSWDYRKDCGGRVQHTLPPYGFAYIQSDNNHLPPRRTKEIANRLLRDSKGGSGLILGIPRR